MPSSLVSSWSAVTNSLVPATLKSMSPKASSAPRMSVSATYSRLAVDLVGDEAHRDAGDRRPQRHTGVEQRHRRGADRAHRGRAVGAERLGHLTDRVGELLARRQHRQRAPARRARRGRSRGASASRRGRSHRWSTAGSCSCACSACASRGERVELLLHAEHVQRGDAEDLGLAALEQRRAVHPREDLDLGGERADVGRGRGRRCGPCRAGRAGGRASWSASGRRAPISFSRPSNCAASFSTASALMRSSSASRSCLPAMVSAAASSSLDGGRRRPRGRRPGSRGRPGTRAVGLAALAASSRCASQSTLMNGFAASRPCGDDLLGRRGRRRRLDELDGARRWPRPRPS